MPLLHRKIAQLLITLVLQIKGIFPLTLRGSTQYAVPGQPYTLICSVPDTSVLIYFRKITAPPSTSTIIGGVQVGSRDNKCYNVAVLSAVKCVPSVCSCVSDGAGKGTEFTWTITPDSGMDQSIWFCRAFNSNESPKFILHFAVPVTSVVLQNPPTAGSDLTVSEGTSTKLVCVTSACRPSASVSWYIGDTNFTSSSSRSVSNETGNLHVTTSTLIFNPKRNMNGERINCSASNYGDTAVTANNLPKLNVLYPPDNKTTMNVSSVSIKEGQKVSVLCEVKGGKPKAKITWNCFGGEATDTSTDTDSRSVIAVVGSSNQNGQLCICRGQHNLVTITPSTTTFNIIVPPEAVRLSATSPITVTEGAYVTNVTCLAHCSPTCSYMWSTLNGGDTTSGSILNLDNIARSMAGTYICNASNQYGNAVSDSLVIIVNYDAGQSIAFKPESGNYTVAENTTLQPISCSASCNPICDISWDKIGGESFKNPLTLGSITKEKAGLYTCRASNIIKTFNKLLTINIKGENEFMEKEHMDGTTACNNSSPNTASIVLFVLSTLVLGVAVAFGIFLYVRCGNQTNAKPKESSTSRDPSNEYDDVQTVSVNAEKDTNIPMTSVYQSLSARDEPSHYDDLGN